MSVENLYSIVLNDRLQNDIELILNGGLSPLEGFMTKTEYESVLEKSELLDGSVFTLPINLYITNEQYEKIQSQEKKSIVLKDEQGFSLAVLNIEDIYKPDLDKECLLAYGTNDDNHPYVSIVNERRNMWYVGGKLTKIQLPRHYDFKDLRRTPEETKAYFKEHGWDIVVGFQTRNPMHRSHYELTRYALKQVGENAKLFLNPAVGITQMCDVNYHARVRCYKEIMKYYDKDQALLSLLPLSMRMAGPKEAVMHAIIRKNYGCTHFIIGRDHAGPSYKTKEGKSFYGPYDAQNLVEKLADRIGIKVVTSQNIVYIKELGSYMPENEVNKEYTIMNLSGTEQRKLLEEGRDLPEWMTYKEISCILMKESLRKRGRCYYFIGLSGAGKSALANALAEKIRENEPERSITILDADVVRLNLSKGLGFSKEDRSTNVRRIGYVASEIVKHGGICIVANIAPFEDDREANRKLIEGYGDYIQIYVNTSLEVCENRDCKGLYKLARAGKIPQFTGISDPFEVPAKNEFVLNGNDNIDTNLDKIYK
jgi:sulfate adenylyltransferase